MPQDLETKKMFIGNWDTMEIHCINGLKQSTYKSKHKSLRKKFEKHIEYDLDQLPRKVDLRPWMSDVTNQLTSNTCTSQAMAAIYEYLQRRSNKKKVDVSRLFIYYNARQKDMESDEPSSPSSILIDDGASITSIIDTLKELGACHESVWPFKEDYINLKPSNDAYAAAQQYTITSAMQLDANLHQMRACLAQGFPFVFGLKIYASFGKAQFNGGVVIVPQTSMKKKEKPTTHAMVAVGYSDHSRAFIVRNSYGRQWGDEGHCYVPYEYMENKLLCSDIWMVTNVSENILGNKEQWVRQDTHNYLAHSSTLGRAAYSDDAEGVFMGGVQVQELIWPEIDVKLSNPNGGENIDIPPRAPDQLPRPPNIPPQIERYRLPPRAPDQPPRPPNTLHQFKHHVLPPIPPIIPRPRTITFRPVIKPTFTWYTIISDEPLKKDPWWRRLWKFLRRLWMKLQQKLSWSKRPEYGETYGGNY